MHPAPVRTRALRPYAPEPPVAPRSGAPSRGDRAPLETDALAGLSDRELLDLLLGPRGSLGVGGDLRRLSNASLAELRREFALPEPEALRLAVALALGRRAAGQPLKRGERLKNAAEIHAAFAPRLRDLAKETLWAVHVDAKGRVLREERLSEGTLTTSPACPREAFSSAVRHGTAGLILLHNHPSGDPEPSQLDVDVTHRMAQAGDILGIPLLDHVVLGDMSYVSLRDRGEIPPPP